MKNNVLNLHRSLWLVFLLLSQGRPGFASREMKVANPAQDAAISHYQNRYNLNDPFTKLVDNTGEGFEPLYGTRNVRAVLRGVVYRGGANNYYHRTNARDNMNPLPADGLKSLCTEGFGTAVYLYTKNFETAKATTNCTSLNGSRNSVKYYQESPQDDEAAGARVLQMVYDKLMSTSDVRPIYLHCWNGWHASGYISTLILRQFCGVSAEAGVRYWNANTDGFNTGASYDAIRAKIRAFQPNPALRISPALQSKVCFAQNW